MSSIGYKPKFYDCTIEGIKCIKGKNYFILKKKQSDDIGAMPILVDQPSELIINRMKEILAGKRNKLYLTRGMRDIDVSYIGTIPMYWLHVRELVQLERITFRADLR